MKEIVITGKEANQRLDKFLLKYFNKAPKSLVYKLMRKKRIKYNGAKCSGSEILAVGSVIQMYVSEETAAALKQADTLNAEMKITFRRLYEDRNILVVDKPSGVLSQKDGSAQNSLIEQVLLYLWERGEYDPDSETPFTPALCNRLDRNTSGIVIVGKTVAALQEMGKALQNGSIEKHYLALVKGTVKHGDKLTAFLVKNAKTNTVTVSREETLSAKRITTAFEPIASNEKYSYLDVLLKTGRPHQIRAHLAFAELPVIGDKKYGHKGTNMTFLRKYGLNRQFLHSYKINFSAMEGDFAYLNGKEVCSSVPSDLSEIIEAVFAR